MACEQWRTDWIGRLYGELDAGVEAALDVHLEGCSSCRDTLGRLASSRRLLEIARPDVPEAPRALLVRTPSWRPFWAFAAGIACAAALFGGGAAVGSRAGFPAARDLASRPTLDEPHPAAAAHAAEREQLVRTLQASIAALDRRLGELERDPRGTQLQRVAGQPARDRQLDEELARLERRLGRERERDLKYLLEALAATEIRTGSWMDQTREALQYLALQQDPRVTEQ